MREVIEKCSGHYEFFSDFIARIERVLSKYGLYLPAYSYRGEREGDLYMVVHDDLGNVAYALHVTWEPDGGNLLEFDVSLRSKDVQSVPPKT